MKNPIVIAALILGLSLIISALIVIYPTYKCMASMGDSDFICITGR